MSALQPRLAAAILASACFLAPGASYAAAITNIGCGYYGTFLMKTDGSLWGFGENDRAQLGLGHFDDVLIRTRIASVNGVISTAHGVDYNLALCADGSVWSAGTGWFGELGTGSDNATNKVFCPIPGLSGVTGIASGDTHSLAVDDEGRMWAWGRNSRGQVGIGGNGDTNQPSRIAGLENVTMAAAGGYHSLALDKGGRAWAWGDNAYGQLGIGSLAYTNRPVQIQGLAGMRALAGGCYHSLALCQDGKVWAWGLGGYGALGLGNQNNTNRPTQIAGLDDVRYIVCGAFFSMALKNDGTVWAWGFNDYGQIGNGMEDLYCLTPQKIPGLSNAVAISAGRDHAAALDSQGRVWAWGNNWSGQMGIGTCGYRMEWTLVPGLDGVGAVTAGSDCSLALKHDGTVWAWGNGGNGQLGAGSNNSVNKPAKIDGLIGVSGISVGENFCAALKANGEVWTWGWNNYGQLGIGAAPDMTNRPVRSIGISGVGAIACGAGHVVASSNGHIWTWGKNTDGQLGNGMLFTNLPTVVGGINLRVVAAGSDHSAVLRPGTGQLFMFGNNSHGELGIGSTMKTNKATAVVGVAPTNLVCGRYHTLALQGDGSVWAWGDNVNGQLGLRFSLLWTNRPARIPSIDNIASLAPGCLAYHCLAMAADGALWAWGDNYYGDDKIVDVNIRRIRMKIEDEPSNPQYIMTIWGFGYKWGTN